MGLSSPYGTGAAWPSSNMMPIISPTEHAHQYNVTGLGPDQSQWQCHNPPHKQTSNGYISLCVLRPLVCVDSLLRIV